MTAHTIPMAQSFCPRREVADIGVIVATILIQRSRAITDVLRFSVDLLLVLNAQDVLDSMTLSQRGDDCGVFLAACAALVDLRYTNTTE